MLRKAYAELSLKQRPVPGYDTPTPMTGTASSFEQRLAARLRLYMAIKRDNGMVDWQQWP